MKRVLLLVYLGISIFSLCILFTEKMVWADTDGVWNQAEDIRGGTFGGDEQPQTSSYTFINPLNLNERLNMNGNPIQQAGIISASRITDTDDTTYVLDPSSRSHLEALRLLSQKNCNILETDTDGNIFCGTDQVADADSSTTNELQNLNQVLNQGQNAGGKDIRNAGVVEVGTIKTPVITTESDQNVYLDRGSNDGNSYFAVRDDSNTWRFLVRENGNVFARNSMQAPKFYDRDNTNYYLDPNKVSRMKQVELTASPSRGQDAATKSYVDSQVGDFATKSYVRSQIDDTATESYVDSQVEQSTNFNTREFRVECGRENCRNDLNMGSGWKYCSLSHVTFRNAGSGNREDDDIQCDVSKRGGSWELEAQTWGGSYGKLECQAFCFK